MLSFVQGIGHANGTETDLAAAQLLPQFCSLFKKLPQELQQVSASQTHACSEHGYSLRIACCIGQPGIATGFSSIYAESCSLFFIFLACCGM